MNPTAPDSPLISPPDQADLDGPPYVVSAAQPFLKVLVYGAPGSGKTTFAATAQDHPDLRNVLVINVEGGLLSVAKRGDLLAKNARTVEHLEKLFFKVVNKAPGYETVKTVVIDSGSELQVSDLESLVLDTVRKKQAQNLQKERQRDDVYVEDYGKSTQRMRRIFRWFRDAPFHLIITALPKFQYPRDSEGKVNENASPIEVSPNFTKKVSVSLEGYVDHVWYMFKDDKTQWNSLLPSAKGAFFAKTRGQHFAKALGDKVENPTIPQMYDLLLKTEGPGQAAVNPDKEKKK